MGVTGLASLIERLTKDARRAPTDLGKLAQEYAKLGNKVTLLVDGLSVLMKIICPPTLADQLLPSYATIDSVVSKFVLAFAQHNINLVFYFDSTSGTQDELHKQLESIKRREQDIDNLIDLEEYINNMDGDKPKNSIYPFLFRWQCTRVLERLGVRTVYCVGEADFALSSDGCKDYVYGILAYDSDFYICKGIRYIPISNLQFADNTISCQTYTIEDTAALLGVPSSSFVDMAILSGNDYTRNLACWHEMKTKHMSTENTINSALTAIKTNNALLTTYKNLVANNAEMKQVYALSCTLYGFSFSVSETNDASGDDFFEMLQMGVQLGKLPYSTLSIAKNGLLTTAVLPESLSGSTATDVVRSLIGAIFVLLGRNDGTLLTRTGVNYVMQEFDPLAAFGVIPGFSLPFGSASVAERFKLLHQGILGNFSSIKNMLDLPPYSGSGDPAQFSVLPPEKLNIFNVHQYHFTELACIFTIASSYQLGDPLTRAEVAAFLACRVILHAASKVNAKVTVNSHYHDKALPAMRMITTLSRYQIVMHNIKDLTMLLGVYGEWVPAPAHMIDGHLFALLCVPSELDEDEMEEVLMERIETALDQNQIRFSANRDQAISEINAAMTSEFSDSYFEVLHAFGDVLLGHESDSAQNESVEFEFAAPTPLRDTTLYMDSPVHLSSVLTPQQPPRPHPAAQPPITPLPKPQFDDTPKSTVQATHVTTPVTTAQGGQTTKNEAGQKELFTMAATLDVLDAGATEDDVAVLPTYNHKILPIVSYTEKIAQTIMDNPVTIIQGETGCGKSSGVPQILLDRCATTSKKKPFIVVTQPRRIAAMSLATYVTKLRGNRGKQEIGYAVGNDRSYTEDCTLLFVTTGWLLQKLVFNSWFFDKCTHIVLDEVHERSVDADLLFLVVKQLFQQGFNENWKTNGTRLILMSATFNSETFGSYFSMPDFPIPDPIFVGVQRYPTETYYLDDMLENDVVDLSTIPYSNTSLVQLARKIENSLHNPSSAPIDKMIELCVYICGKIALHHREDEGGNCIIVFLPGIMEIEQMVDSLKEILGGREEEQYMSLIILHSMIEKEDQMRAFDPLEPYVTRLVLSTNIAESSITLPQVRYVLDIGMHKQMFHSVKYNSPCLMGMWVSQASSMQRAGRAGRLFPGTIFRMYSKKFYTMLPAYDPPEILRISLDSTLLRLLVLGEQSGGGPFESPSSALAQALDPPTEEAVGSAYNSLLHVGAIIRPTADDPLAAHANKDGVALTSLGQFLMHIPFDLRIGRMVAYGAILGKYLPHALVMASALSLQEVFLMPNFLKGDSSLLSMVSSTQKSRIAFDGGSFSDCVTSVRIYKEYMKAKRQKKAQKDFHGKMSYWCRTNGIHQKRMKLLINTISEVANRILSIDPKYSKHLSQLCKQNERYDDPITCLPLEHEDVAIIKLFLAHTFSSNIVEGSIKKQKDGMHDIIEIKKVPGKVLSASFRDKIEHLTTRFQHYALENTSAPKKKSRSTMKKDKKGKGAEDTSADVAFDEAPQPYFSVKIQFFADGGDDGSHVVYPPLGKHVLAKFFHRGELSVMPGVLGDKQLDEAPPNVAAPSSFTSFASRETPHILSDLVTGWKVSWNKAGGGPSLMLDKASPFNTLQLSLRTSKKSHTVFAVAPFLTALGGSQKIMLAERLTLFPSSEDDSVPTTALYFALAVRSLDKDLVTDNSKSFLIGACFGDIAVPLVPHLPIAVMPLLQTIHSYVHNGMFDIMSWSYENQATLLNQVRRVVGLTYADCENFAYDMGGAPSKSSFYDNFSSSSFSHHPSSSSSHPHPSSSHHPHPSSSHPHPSSHYNNNNNLTKYKVKDPSLKAKQKEEKKLRKEEKARKKEEKRKNKQLANQMAALQLQGTQDPANGVNQGVAPVTNGTGASGNGTAVAAAAAAKKAKKVSAKCNLCFHVYKGDYEKHIQTKEHAKALVHGITDPAKKHQVLYENLVKEFSQSKIPKYHEKIVCHQCLALIKAGNMEKHQATAHTTPNIK